MFSNKRICCHILDRKDQVEQGKEHLEYLKGETPELEKAVLDAQKALDDHRAAIANQEKFIKDVEATLDTHWLENPPY
jgi:hypothetical protein